MSRALLHIITDRLRATFCHKWYYPHFMNEESEVREDKYLA